MPAALEFEQATYTAEEWLDDLMARLGWHDRQRTYVALAAALHALRDALPQEAAIDVGNQLPVLVRGLYYDGWHPRGRRAAHTRPDFLERIHDGVHRDLRRGRSSFHLRRRAGPIGPRSRRRQKQYSATRSFRA